MQSDPGEASFNVKKEANEILGSRFSGYAYGNLQDPIEVSSSSEESDSTDSEDVDDTDMAILSKQLVLYNPVANDTTNIVHVPQPIRCHLPFGKQSNPNAPSRVLPSVGAFTVQCATCFKWRLIPTKEKYEEIREHILEQPFYCETARDWRPDISCNDETDISQDGSRLWAIDKPNIAQPPPGWQRLLRIRGEGSTRFADVYYVAPSGKRFRSMVEIQKYLIEHPEYIRDGVTLSQFSFQIPRPLQEDYVRKRPVRITDNAKPLEPDLVNHLAWADPDDCTDLQLGVPALPPPPYFEAPVSDPFERPSSKLARRTRDPFEASVSDPFERQSKKHARRTHVPFEPPVFDPFDRPPKNHARRIHDPFEGPSEKLARRRHEPFEHSWKKVGKRTPKQMYSSNPAYSRGQADVEENAQSTNSSF